MRIKRSFVVGFCLVASMFLAVPVFADEEMLIQENPTEQSDEAAEIVGDVLTCIRYGDSVDFGVLQEKGRTYTKELTVENVCANDLIVKAEIAPLGNDDLSNERKAASDWLALMGGVDTYVVPGKKSKNISTRVTLPLEVEGGSYYAALKLRSEDGSLDKWVPIRLDVFDDKFAYGGELKKADFDVFNGYGNIRGTVQIANNGNVGFESTIKVSFKPLFGGEEQVIRDTSTEVLPGTTYENIILYKEGVADCDLNGLYRASYEISYVNNEGRVINYKTSRIVVSLQKKTIFIIGGAVVGLIVLIIIIKASVGAVKRKKTNKKYKDVDNEL